MRSRWIAGVVLTLALMLGGTVLSAPAADKGDQELRTLITKIAQAWESLDISKVDPFYAKDPDLPFFDIAPLKYANWAEYRTGVQKAFFEPNKSLKFKLNDDMKIHRNRSLAWATFTFGADVVDKKDATSHLDGRWTMILEQRKGQWTVLHEHVSVPLAGS